MLGWNGRPQAAATDEQSAWSTDIYPFSPLILACERWRLWGQVLSVRRPLAGNRSTAGAARGEEFIPNRPFVRVRYWTWPGAGWRLGSRRPDILTVVRDFLRTSGGTILVAVLVVINVVLITGLVIRHRDLSTASTAIPGGAASATQQSLGDDNVLI